MFKQTFDLFPEEMWVTAVQVATVWTNPDSIREIDQDGLTNPTNIEDWIDSLSYENSLALCDENRVQSQILYGEAVLVTEVKDDFAHIIIPSQPSIKDERGYPGWVPLQQLMKVKKQEWIKPETAAVKTNKAWLQSEDGAKRMKVSYLTLLPVEAIDEERVEVKTPHGNLFLPLEDIHVFPTEEGNVKGSGENIARAGEQFLNLSYFWGGMSAFGYDCSGLAYAAHKANGYMIPRDASDQAHSGSEVALNALEPGDLLFFAYEEGKGRIHHVGIYYRDGKMLHSPETGKGIEIIPLAGTKYEKELCIAKRYWT